MADLGDPKLIPVVIGSGQINDRPATGADGLDSLGLMIAASRAAGEDASGGILNRTDWLGVVNQISFPQLTGTLIEGISDALSINPSFARETPSPTGDSPILLINQAANAIGEGKAQIALIVGAEALRTAGMRLAEAAAAGTDKTGPYPTRAPATLEPRHLYGLNTPTDVYPLFENAARSAFGQSLEQAQSETGQIWSGMSKVAANTHSAWIQNEKSESEIVKATAQNRPIAFPYTKFQVANAAVNQGAAVIVTSLAIAREAGIPDAHIIYVGKGAAAHEDDDPLQRPDFASSASMETSLVNALKLNNITAEVIDHLELYSCFPIVPKMARRVIGVDADRQMTMFGGLTFGGGPIGNYMTHAAACMTDALRQSGTNGLLFANGGYATHNHTILLTKTPQPAGTFPQNFDFQTQADEARGAVPEMLAEHTGPAKIETYTVLFSRDGKPKQGVVIAQTSVGKRTIATVPADDHTAIAKLLGGDSDLIGAAGHSKTLDGRNVWSFD